MRKVRLKKVLLWSAAVLVVAAGGFLGYMELVKHAIIRYNKYDRRERGPLREGLPATDVSLTMYDGSPLRLSQLWTRRPLFLVFGSCT
jgi:hypothetical protein